MDYFKHYSTAAEGNTLNHLMDKFGLNGYAYWFLLLELCCSNWDGKSEPKFNFFSAIVRKKLRISSTKLQLFLEYCSTISEVSFNFSEKNLEICLPMLAEIKETRGRISGNKPKKIDIYRIDKEEDKDTDKESNNADEVLDLEQAKAGLELPKFFAPFDPEAVDRVVNREVANHVANQVYNLKPRPADAAEWPEVKPDKLIQMFNDRLAGKAGKIQFCRGLSSNQAKAFITTSSFKEFSTAQVWEEIFEKVAKSPFLNGSKKGSSFVATLDWLIIHDNALKVINGKYQEEPEEGPDSIQDYVNSVELN